MIILLSPAKTLDFESQAVHPTCTAPDFLPFSRDLVSGLKKLSSEEISRFDNLVAKLRIIFETEAYIVQEIQHVHDIEIA